MVHRTWTRCSAAPGPLLMPPLWTELSRDDVPSVARALRQRRRASLRPDQKYSRGAVRRHVHQAGSL